MKHLLLSLSCLSFITVSFGQYCVSGGPSQTADSNVESVSLVGASGSISYTGCPGVTGVEEVLGQSVTLTAGNSYTAWVQFGTCNGNYFGYGEAWIDFNGNQTFDQSESIGTWQGTPPVAISQFNFTVPAGATNGTFRMRVMQREGGGAPPLDPCAAFTWGSVVDFTVVIQGGSGSAYCNAGPSQTADSNVESVTITGLNSTSINYTGCPGQAGLEVYTAETVDLGIGNLHTVNILFGTCNGIYGGAGEAWIDYNQNSTFEPGESIGQWQGTPQSLESFTFQVPAGATQGPTRMRVIQQEGGTPPPLNPCATFTWGSATDFMINIVPGFDCSSYPGDYEAVAIDVSTFPYVDSRSTDHFCYTDQNPAYLSPDVFYSVKPSGSTNTMIVSLCGSSFDTFLSVYDPQGNPLAFNDDSQNCGLQSELQVNIVGYDSVYVVVEGYGTAMGNYTLTINEALGLNDLESNPFVLFPNPSSSSFQINGLENEVISILDAKGSVIKTLTYIKDQVIEVNDLENGIYFVNIDTEFKKHILKLIVNK